VVEKLDQADIPYMISGSVASSFHGQPRTTMDVDLVIDPTAAQLKTFVASLGEDFYVSAQAAKAAIRNRTAFNVVHRRSGWKADLLVRRDRPYSIEEFNRRRPARLFGADLIVVSPEDSILSKLEWAQKSGSERQFRDAVGVAMIQQAHIDTGYLEKWARDLGIDALLHRLLAEVKRLS
jgi:hypothetical protein